MLGFIKRAPTLEIGLACADRASAVAAQFGLDCQPSWCEAPAPSELLSRFGPRRLVFVTGPSGSGKSSLLARVHRATHGVFVDRMAFPADRPVVDCVATFDGLQESIALLTACGLGEPRLWVRPLCALSDGEKFRARLAKAVSLFASAGARGSLFCDEFCSCLHRRLAKAVAFNLRKLVSRRKLSVIVAASCDDFVDDLQPDAVVRLASGGTFAIEDREVQPARSFSLRKRLVLVPGGKRDYEEFAHMHYRATDELGFVDKIFVLRERTTAEPLGIVVYAHGPLELALRNQATDGWFSRNPQRVNESLRILRRLVIHPDLRGCGLAHELVRRTLRMVGVELVECLASMGEFNPVFEKAGMERIGQYPVSKERQDALLELQSLGVDVNSREFVIQVCRCPQVRAIVHRVVARWYAATTGGGESRVIRQSPELLARTFRGIIGVRPVYYLWKRCRSGRTRMADGQSKEASATTAQTADGESRMSCGTAKGESKTAKGPRRFKECTRHKVEAASDLRCDVQAAASRVTKRANPYTVPARRAQPVKGNRDRPRRKSSRPERAGAGHGMD